MTDSPERLSASLTDRYRIEREIGAGGMATVYLAHDLRHDRPVAIKVLHPELSAVIGAERFLAEIKTTAALQHPHILPLFDSGTADGLLFYVMPLVEGETLRARLAREKQLPIVDAARIAKEVASALDYAHRRGIIHRDIKPENILLHEGQALVADFGIALAVQSAGGQRMTQTGLSLGTPQYMSPEQAMGEREITPRSDVYSLGAVTYEMLAGEPPFTGPTTQAIVARVMNDDPRSIVAQRKNVPAEMEEAVFTALEKLPADRFGSAAEFAAALDATGGASLATSTARRRSAAPRGRRVLIPVMLAAAGALAVGFIAGRAAMRDASNATVQFAQKTFDDRAIFNARFAPDRRTILYSAMAEGRRPQVYVVRPEYAEPQPLGLEDAHVLSVSSQGELAVLVRARYVGQRLFLGTLARVAIGGGAPRELLDGVREADWSPDGSQIAVIRQVGSRDRLEFPIGTTLIESAGYLSDPRFSRDGKYIAFAEHPIRYDDRGTINIVDRTGKKTVLTPQEFSSIEGIAWSANGNEVLFSARGASHQMLVTAVTTSGKSRVVLGSAGDLTIQDVLPDGRWLVSRDAHSTHVNVRAPGATEEHEAGWLDGSFQTVLSGDGQLLAFGDATAEGGVNYSVILRKTAGGPAARLGEGEPTAFSPDGKWLLAFIPSTPPRLVMYPTGAGSERRLGAGDLEHLLSAEWGPDAKSLLLCGNQRGQKPGCFFLPVEGGGPLRPAPLGHVRNGSIAPDGRTMVIAIPGARPQIGTPAGDNIRPIPGLGKTDVIEGWTPDSRGLWARQPKTFTVDRIDIDTGRRTRVLDLPFPATGVVGIFVLGGDPPAYAYVMTTRASQLFTVDRVR